MSTRCVLKKQVASSLCLLCHILPALGRDCVLERCSIIAFESDGETILKGKGRVRLSNLLYPNFMLFLLEARFFYELFIKGVLL
jgi:hypothetical protein